MLKETSPQVLEEPIIGVQEKKEEEAFISFKIQHRSIKRQKKGRGG